MARRHHSELAFPALTIEGGLLAPDFLNRIAHLQAEEQTETDYDIPRGLKLRDEIGRYWKIAENLWKDFSALRQRTDTDSHASTVEHFLEPFFRHVLGFTDLTRVGQVTLEERVFPIGLSAGGGKIPLIVAGHNQPLDKPDTRFGDGSRRRSPFLLAQEYLNANPDTLWAIVGNGLTLRVLRNNPSLTRPAYIEANLEAIFDEGLYPDFTALWLLAHATRFGRPGAAPGDATLERWRNTAQEDGVRARNRLSEGVTQALRTLGTGFLVHPRNVALRQRIESGELSTVSFFEQLLRLIYRLIFLATIEDRDLIFTQNADDIAKARYREGYSLRRLRELASKRRSYDKHTDLWQGLMVTFSSLGVGQPALGLPALGGLFDATQCGDIDAAQLENASLLSALYNLCFFRDGAVLSRVNYRDMDSEEMGSVYERLLELQPQVALSTGVREFGFAQCAEEIVAQGTTRKRSGSYYTPPSIVHEIIKSTLDPIIERTLLENATNPSEALLSLSICDPACGSGHFLLASARRIAEELAKLYSSDGMPLPQDYRRALRNVISKCIFGVDRNPMAVELARMALWLEGFAEGQPLNFLDHHLQVGDALLGIDTVDSLFQGIPADAFQPLADDDRATCSQLRSINRAGQRQIARDLQSGQLLLNLNGESHFQELLAVEALPTTTTDEVNEKKLAYNRYFNKVEEASITLAANMYVAPFLIRKTPANAEFIPTSNSLHALLTASLTAEHIPLFSPASRTVRIVEAHCSDSKVFHWPLRFPQVFARGGFDCVIGNPPWEIIQDRDLNDDDTLLDRMKKWFNSGVFNVLSGRRDLYKLFLVRASSIVNEKGRCGLVLPLGFLFEDDCQTLRKKLFDEGSVTSILHVQNARKAFFLHVHASYRFVCLTYTPERTHSHRFSTVVASPHELSSTSWWEVPRSNLDIMLGPERGGVIFSTLAQAETHSSLKNKALNVAQLDYRVVAEFHASTDKSLLTNSRQQVSDWALLKNGSFHHFNPYFGAVEKWVSQEEAHIRFERKGLDPATWVKNPRLVFRDIARNDDSRTLIPCLVPQNFLSTYDAPMVVPTSTQHQSPLALAFYTGFLTSLLADFLIRPFVDKHIKGYVLARVPIPKFCPQNVLMAQAAETALQLAESSWRRAQNDDSDLVINLSHPKRVALEVLYMKIINGTRDELVSVMASFKSVGSDEVARILHFWDSFTE